MTAKGHMILSIPITVVSMHFAQDIFFEMNFSKMDLILFYFFVLVGSVFPDIDEPESFIGRKLPIFSNILSLFVSHRGITHFMIIPIVVFILAYFENDYRIKIILVGLGVGIFAHSIGDMLTKGGVVGYFFPFFRKTKVALLPSFLRFYTNSITEHLFNAIILFSIIYSLIFYTQIYITFNF